MYLNKKDMKQEITNVDPFGRNVTTKFYENSDYFYFEIVNPYVDTLSTVIQIRNVSNKRNDNGALQISIESTIQKTKQIRTEHTSFSLPESMIENFIQAITQSKSHK